jgi:hypothetical protein
MLSPKSGKIRKVKPQNTHQTDDTIPNTANALGIYLDLKNKKLQTAEANPQNGKPT